MRCLFAGISILFCFGPATVRAQQGFASKTQSNSSKATCSIGGTVVKSDTSDPIRKAQISLQKADDPHSGYLTHTDSMGRFAIDKIEPGRYRLYVEKSGYVSQKYGESSPTSAGAILTLTPGHDARDLLFHLIPWGAISGRVSNEDGDPFPDVSVQVMHYVIREGKRTLELSAEQNSDDRGDYRIYRLPKGRYFVRAILNEHWIRTQTSLNEDDDPGTNNGYAPVYYPGTADPARAVPVYVDTAQEVPDIDFTLIPIRSFRVRGRVFDAMLGQAPSNCFASLIHRDTATTDPHSNDQGQTVCEKGTFEFTDVPPGSYSVFVRAFGDGKTRSARALVTVIDTNVNDVNVTFRRGMSLSGRISVEGGQSMDFSEVQVWLTDTDDYLGGGAGAKVKPDGTLAFENLPEGVYQFEIGGRPPIFFTRFLHEGCLGE
jgi:hypothetical protein